MVKATGFISLKEQFAEMEEGLIRIIGIEKVPEPIQLTHKSIVESARRYQYGGKVNIAKGGQGETDFHGRLVSLLGNIERIDNDSDEGPKIYVNCEGL